MLLWAECYFVLWNDLNCKCFESIFGDLELAFLRAKLNR